MRCLGRVCAECVQVGCERVWVVQCVRGVIGGVSVCLFFFPFISLLLFVLRAI